MLVRGWVPHLLVTAGTARGCILEGGVCSTSHRPAAPKKRSALSGPGANLGAMDNLTGLQLLLAFRGPWKFGKWEAL